MSVEFSVCASFFLFCFFKRKGPCPPLGFLLNCRGAGGRGTGQRGVTGRRRMGRRWTGAGGRGTGGQGMGGRGTGGQAQAAQVPGEPFAPAGVPAFTLPLLVLSAS